MWTAVDRKNKKLVDFEVGTRETKYFENLSSKIEHIEPKKYASDQYKEYDIIDPEKRLVGKFYTYTVERMNRLLYHYLACFACKTYCYTKDKKQNLSNNICNIGTEANSRFWYCFW